MTCVNQVFRGRFICTEKLDMPILYRKLIRIFDDVSFYDSHPCMIKIVDVDFNTIILFNSGKYRLMGSNISHFDTISRLHSALVHLRLIPTYPALQPPSLQSETLVYNFNRQFNPSLIKSTWPHSNDRLIRHEGEIFCALELLKWQPIHVNLFHSGKCVILGRDSRVKLYEIIDWVNSNIL